MPKRHLESKTRKCQQEMMAHDTIDIESRSRKRQNQHIPFCSRHPKAFFTSSFVSKTMIRKETGKTSYEFLLFKNSLIACKELLWTSRGCCTDEAARPLRVDGFRRDLLVGLARGVSAAETDMRAAARLQIAKKGNSQ